MPKEELRPKGTSRKRPHCSVDQPNGVYKQEYKVEQILAHKVQNKKQLFLVKWENWSEENNTWEPLEHLENCPKILENFLTASLGENIMAQLRARFEMKMKLEDSDLEMFIPKIGFGGLPPKIEIQRKLLQLAASKSDGTKSLMCAKKLIYMYMLLQRREAQLQRLADWENEINEICRDPIPIRVENNVDLEDPPSGFIYVNNYIPWKGIIIPDDPPIGCECDDCNGNQKTCCGKLHGSFPYHKTNKIHVPPGAPIYECNKRCKCPEDCRNRVVQRGRKVPLCIYRTANGCGWGVKAMRKIYRGEFICEYVGEVITYEEAERRGQLYDAIGRTYLFDLDFNDSEHPYTVDAATYGNVSHFINHSCEPNLGVWAVWINCLDPNIPKLALFSTQEIDKDEELTFDYMSNNKEETKSNSSTPNSKKNGFESPGRSRLEASNDQNEDVMKTRQLCKCAAKRCRKYLF